ncbi:hypothetical protein NDU88_008117 [Pleurodeles waltl]|uniref:Uncharacterized protein n=1 Tax=Pleurodeles waltl TaxID=8319 RepID=A0AAV7N5E9_PLEWA|nr:hypothetical protein NDU88_008117 [Pleurodeles waltl]
MSPVPLSPQTLWLRWVPYRWRGPGSRPLATRSRSFARLLVAPDVLVRSPAERVALAPRVLAECTAGFSRYSQGRRSIAFTPTGARQSPRSSSLWWRDLNGGLRVLLRSRRLPCGSRRGSGPLRRRSPPPLLTAHLASCFGVGTVASRVLRVLVPPHRVGAGRPPSFPLVLWALLSRLCRAAILSYPSTSAPGPLGRPETARSLYASVSRCARGSIMCQR